MPNLILLFALPFALSLAAFCFPFPRFSQSKWLVIALSLFPLAALLYGRGEWVGSNVDYVWMPALSIHFHLGIDTLTLIFLGLTSLVIPLSLFAVNVSRLPHPRVFYGLVFLLQGLLFGFFMSRDLAVFTFFWEAVLIPLYLIITIWGGVNRHTAALKFLIYMIAGSCLMVAAVLFLYASNGAGTFDMDSLAKTAASSPHALFVFAVFLLAFAVKTPLFPFHAWLPDAYCQAPTSGTILLSAILSKAGIYGFLRVGLGFFPSLMMEWSPWLTGLAIAGVLYGGLAAWRQSDFKRLIAYSSFSHVNFILVGVFVWNEVSHNGAILQVINHGITIAALFLAAGWLEERLGTTTMGTYTGVAKSMPMLCWVTFLFVLSSVALPATNNFVGELLILFGLFQVNPWAAAVLGLTIILTVIYMLRWMQKVYFETPSPVQASWRDLHLSEWLVAAPLIALILWIGIYPTPILKYTGAAAKKIDSVVLTKETQ